MPDGATFIWKHGGSEPLHFTNLGPRWWAAVWQLRSGEYQGWVCGPGHRFFEVRSTEDDAREWCEGKLKENGP